MRALETRPTTRRNGRLVAGRAKRRLERAARALLSTAVWQAASQALSFLTGIIIVRYLPPSEYGIYVLMAAFVGASGTLCDMGTGGALYALGGKQSGAARERVIATLDWLRRRVTMGSIVLLGSLALFQPALWEAGRFRGLLVLILGLGIVGVQSRKQWLEKIAALEGAYPKINHFVAAFAVTRFVMIGILFLAAGTSSASAALAPWLIALTMTMFLLARSGRPHAGVDPEIVRHAIYYARPLWFGQIYFAASGLAPLYALGLVSGQTPVAEFGALSRIGQLATLAAPITAYLVVPFVARGVFSRRAPLALAWLVIVAASLLLVGFLLPSQLLWVLGGGYGHLDSYILATMGLSALSIVQGGLYQLLLAGGHTQYEWTARLTGIAAQMGSLVWMPISDLYSAFVFAYASAAAPTAVYLFLIFRAFHIDKAREQSS